MQTQTTRDGAIERARHKMIAQQIRTWDVLDESVLDLLSLVHREDFVPPAYRNLAFVDTGIPLVVDGTETGETMLAPKFEARMLQEVGVRTGETVLEIGAGSGYMAALLAQKAAKVVTVEIDPTLRAFASANLARAGIANVRVDLGNGASGWPAAGEVDVLVVSGSLHAVPRAMLDQVRVGGRIACIVGDAPAMAAEIRHRDANGWTTVKLFETVVKRLRESPHVSRFTF